MRVDIMNGPSYAMAVCTMDQGETLCTERGSMAMMSQGLQVSVESGGVVNGLLRKHLGGETFFQGRYTATHQNAFVAVSPRCPGDIAVVELGPDRPAIHAESGSLLACTDGVDVDVKWAGVRSVMLREGATLLRLAGTGTALLCTYGGFVNYQLQPGQSLVVDTGHLVAYEDTIRMEIGPLGGVVVAAATGEGLVATLTAGSEPGQVWAQTRSPEELRGWLMPERLQNHSR